MEKTSKRFDKIISLMQQREKQLAIKLARTQGILFKQTELMTQLHQYENEYQKQLIAKGQQGLPGGELGSFDAFLSQLKNSVVCQDEALKAAMHEYETAKTLWEEAYKRVKVLSKVRAGMVSHERNLEEKRLLAEMEEWLQKCSYDE